MKHAFAKLYGCFYDAEQLEVAMCAVVEELQMNVLDSKFHTFQPQGVTGVLLLSESHFAIHTWPERGYAMVDLFTCGDVEPGFGIQLLANHLGAHFEMSCIDREFNYVV